MRTTRRSPSLRVERALQRDGFPVLAGMDEVGRGALAGPVSVGVVIIDERNRSAPAGVRDSKLLTPIARERMVPAIRRWARGYAVGHASSAEIDVIGIIAALRLAGTRALTMLEAAGIVPDLVILDGNHDWLTAPQEQGLLAFAGDSAHDLGAAAPSTDHAIEGSAGTGRRRVPPVTTLIKADLRCSSVAAASVLAKVERDALMVRAGADHPAYGWEVNKGYSAPEHLRALAERGPCDLHRRSWRLPGIEPSVVEPGRTAGQRASRPDTDPVLGESVIEQES